MTRDRADAREVRVENAISRASAFRPADLGGREACAGTGLLRWFFADNREDTAAAARICDRCPVSLDCLKAAVDRRERWGVWGGVVFHTPRYERSVVSRQVPCGTRGGAVRHRRNGEPRCGPCTAAERAYDQARRARAREASA